MPPAIFDFAHIVEKGRDGNAVGRLEPGYESHYPVNFQGVLSQSAGLCVVTSSRPGEEVRCFEVTYDRINPWTPGGTEYFDDTFFVGHDSCVCPVFLRPAADD